MEVFWLILSICIKDVYNFHVDKSSSLNPNVFIEYNDENVYQGWFSQTLDHFNPVDDRSWRQRYSVYKKLGDGSNNVAFLFIGAQHNYHVTPMTSSAWISYAKHFKALCVQLEHRYYGKSHPTENMSVENLRYLTSRQAVADLANFIRFINIAYGLSPNVKWIVFGDQYAGALAIWLKQLYPHFVHGTVASSAIPQAKLNFKEYYKTIYDILRSHSEACLVAVKNGISQIQFLLKVDESQEILNDLFHPCTPIEKDVNKTYDLDYFFYKLSSHFANFLLNQQWKYNLQRLCEIMTKEITGIQIQRLAKVNDLILKMQKSKCLKISYDKWIDSNRSANWTSAATSWIRQWSYQECTEFGLFPTSDYKPQIFGDKYPLDFFITKCQRLFGPTFDKMFISDAVDKTNFFYGGFNKEVSNVVVVYGSLDIWKPLKVIKNIKNSSSIIVVNGTINSEVSDAFARNNSPNIRTTRLEIQKLIQQWIEDKLRTSSE